MKTQIKVTSDSKKPNKDGLLNIKLRIKNVDGRLVKQLGVKVSNEHWNESAGHIKNEFWSNYPAYVNLINTIYANRNIVDVPLNKGEMSMQVAFEILTGSDKKTGSILEWVENFKPTVKISGSTIKKHCDNISAINNKLRKHGLKGYYPLEFTHIQSESDVKKIAEVIIVKGGLKTNTQSSYLKSLNWVCTNAKLPRKNPFTEQGYMPSQKESDKNHPLDSTDLMMAFNNINTLQQFEALLFWLYSFCFLGLDGKDLANISESDIVTDGYIRGDLDDYIPEADVLGQEQKRYLQPYHIHIKRGKSKGNATDSGIDAIFQANLFPTLIILELLKHCINHNPNNYGYTGGDKLKLYNFDVESVDGLKEWENVRKFYAKVMSKKVNTTTQRTRHTITSLAQRIGLTEREIDRMLNHSVGGVIKHYIAKEQTKQDVCQMHIFQEYKLLKIVRDLIVMFKDKTHALPSGDIVKYIPDSFFYRKIGKRKVPIVHRMQILELGRLTKFSREDEIRYQTLMKEALKGDAQFKDGKMIRTEISPDNYPKELKDLILKRNKLYSESTPKLSDKIKVLEDEINPDAKVVSINSKVS